ncbi:hypothetical protein CBR_g41321 [Chara braunii]|uniref:Uncharacterized protein n=1 Tax=Chara braunii TaxID=69332 RepID=A0A388LVH2_CHABU|nr:hypothetical protein CBR_g41321 [Chara braunii]|eukprot:GBG86327.1 hypothetical protein CBR_g41321 [Chara braunii]
MENTPTKRMSFAQTKALALQTGGLDAKAYLGGVLEKLGKGVPESHLEKQFGDEDGREFMSPDQSKGSRDSGEWKGGNRGNWKKSDGTTQEVIPGKIWVPSIRFEENRYTEENEEEDTLCRTSTEMNIDFKVRTAEEPEKGEFWVSSLRFEEEPDPNDSLKVGVFNIRFESCEEDSDATLVCAKKVSEESNENEADNTSLDNKVSSRGEGPKVIQENLVNQTTTMEVEAMEEECEDSKGAGDTQSERIEDPDMSYGLAQLLEIIERDMSCELQVAQQCETIQADINYDLAQLFETVEPDVSYELAQLFETVEQDVGYDLSQLFEIIDISENVAENCLAVTASPNPIAMNDIEDFGMSHYTLIS